MGALSMPMIDVRDMLCAQALARVARVVQKSAIGHRTEVRYSTADVRHDLMVWAADRGHGVDEPAPQVVRIRRCG